MSLHLFIIGGVVAGPVIAGAWCWCRGEGSADFLVRLSVSYSLYFVVAAVVAWFDLSRVMP